MRVLRLILFFNWIIWTIYKIIKLPIKFIIQNLKINFKINLKINF